MQLNESSFNIHRQDKIGSLSKNYAFLTLQKIDVSNTLAKKRTYFQSHLLENIAYYFILKYVSFPYTKKLSFNN